MRNKSERKSFLFCMTVCTVKRSARSLSSSKTQRDAQMTLRNKLLVTLVLLIANNFRETHGRGSMIEPLSRSSTWRKNFPTKINLADDNLNCGGPIVQYRNNGKCGVCGDNYSLARPRPNENGGTYGKGMIVRAYRKASYINVIVQPSDHLQGWFNFDVCPLNQDNQQETEECFYHYRLPLADGNGYIFNVTRTGKQLRNVVVTLKLPDNLICRHCVLRWQFHSIDNFKAKYNGYEWPMIKWSATWRNCADIAILKAWSLPARPEKIYSH